MKLRNPFKNLTKFEWVLWTFSLAAITASFFAVGNTNYETLATSLLGVTSLIFMARGDVFGMIIMICFSIIYAVVSFFAHYYGETCIYVFMQLPCGVTSLISWLKNPSGKGAAEVKIGKFTRKHLAVLIPLVVTVTTAFYFILRAFNTENLIVSTLSVATSITALYLMILRLPAYALAFILNDIVLIVLWTMACLTSISYLSLAVCFSIFLINDVYTFISWIKRKKIQNAESQ
ncbi:MAG: nicotinamide riboside transporter PnuC [Clostridia bacterium]|nr:nicotinamide riboside transporter PnuC [Clostridia bacterium]